MTGLDTFVSRLRQMTRHAAGHAGDVELLRRYLEAGDAAAFEVLVWRHGAMVHQVCRRVLRCEYDAEDAFQAAFVLLARKGGTVIRGESVGAWLYRVAARVAFRARERRNVREQSLELSWDSAAPRPYHDVLNSELRDILDEEILGLPDRYRAAFVLCHVEGRTREQAARELGCPRGTVDSRVAWALARLRRRLARRGVGPAACGASLAILAEAGAAPLRLVEATVRVVVGGNAHVPAAVAQLTSEVLRTMLWRKVKLVAAALIVAGVLGIAGWQSATTPAQQPAAGKPANAALAPTDAGWRLVLDVAGPSKDLFGLAFSPDGKLLAVAGRPAWEGANATALLDPRTGKEVRRLATPEPVTGLAFSPNGKRIALIQNNGILLYDAVTGDPTNRIELKNQPDQVLFARDGGLIVATRDGMAMKLNSSGRVIWTAAPTRPTRHVAISPDGKTVAAGGDEAVTLLDASTGWALRHVGNGGGATQWVEYSPDGKRVAVAVIGEVRLIDLDTGKRTEFPSMQNVLRQPCLALSFSPDGKYLACANADGWSVQQHQVTVIGLATGQINALLGGHTDRVWAVAFSPDGRLLATSDAAGRVKVWERVGGPARATAGTSNSPLVTDRLDQLVAQLVKSNRTDAQIVEVVFVAALGRLPTDVEQQRALDRIAKSADRSRGFTDLLSTLTGSAEYGSHVDDLRRRDPRLGK